MNPEYAAYCEADRVFYDAPHRSSAGRQGEGALYGPAREAAPEGWERSRRGDWLSLSPLGLRVPSQGWKIHVSAGLDNAESVLRRVLDYCLPRRLPVKFIPGPALLHLRNAKYADRAGSGKFITVYPHSEDQFQDVCEGLMALLEGEHGPYILSDLRCGSGPVHVRYGAFAPRFCPAPDGRLVPAVADPQGRLVPDPRGPSLNIPAWVTPPPFLLPHLEARKAVGLADVPYSVEGALHFSNGGGVYLGRDTRSGERVVLKEARPYAGLAADGADAVARLERERVALEQLTGLDCVPEVRDTLDIGEHRFLVLQHVPGATLNAVFARRFPLSQAEPTPELIAEHAAWATRLYGLVERAVLDVHERGVVISDLHMSNIMVSEDESRVVLLDFEAASRTDERRRQIVANPAFVAPSDRRGADIDRYALACLRLALFLPLTTLFAIDRRKAARLAEEISLIYGIPEARLRPAVEEILRDATPDTAPIAKTRTRTGTQTGTTAAVVADDRPDAWGPSVSALGDWPRSRDSMARAIIDSRTPERDDRCFPGDIAQFASPAGGQSFGYGAAGVLHALRETGAPSCPEAAEWLLARVKSPAPGTPVGFYDGLAGIAWTLDRLGHQDQATELALLVAKQPLEGLTADLHSGYAGVALALHDLARAADTQDAAVLADAADRCTALAARSLTDGPPTSRTGLLHGATGIALLFVRRYEATGDPALLDLAATALRRDLARCQEGADGALLVVEGKRTMPYLGAGSAGLATVIDDYLRHRPGDEAFAAALHALLPASRSAFYVQPGLFRGVAGLVLQLARTSAGEPADRQRVIRRHTALLGLHVMPYQGEVAFPGEQLMRLSMDLSTGTAGCLLALGSALGDTPASLPFLPPNGAHRAGQGGPQTGPIRGRC
ncbi:serine/threonine protein kinase [Streptomyces sp. AcH 505]|uniref:class III lanthionine synthetase LanKC n=1 Tax=Streptomyces sp. AcH 505 TaxID=352211 RepID=UPI000591D5C6|nr:serine/threonine protein kinase [Streptomyces sp. AcH 505]